MASSPLTPSEQLLQDLIAQDPEGARQFLPASSPGSTIARERLDDATFRRHEELSQLTGRDGLRARVQAEDGVTSFGSEVERDMATMSQAQLYGKYGQAADAIAAAQARGDSMVEAVENMPGRSPLQMAGDTAVDAWTGFSNLVGGLGSLGAGYVVDPILGTNIGQDLATGTKNAREMYEGAQSEVLQRERDLSRFRAQTNYEDNARRSQAEQDEGGSPFMAGLRRMGRDFIDGVSSASSSGPAFVSEATQSAVSMLAVGPLARSISAAAAPVNSVAANVAARAGLSPEALAAAGAVTSRVGSVAPVPAAIGLMEGGSSYVDASNRVMEMTHEELMEGSEYYRQMIAEDGDTPETRESAKEDVAGMTARQAGATQALVGAATGMIVRKQEASLANLARPESLVGNAAREAVEEGIQGGTGAFNVNASVASYADPDADLLEGVGGGSGQGALYGAVTSGVVGLPGRAASAAVDGARGAGRLTVSAARAVAAPLMERGERVMEEIRTRSPMSREGMSKAFSILTERASSAVESLTNAVSAAGEDQVSQEEKGSVVDYARRLFSNVSVQPEEIANDSVDEDVKAAVDTSRNRYEVMEQLADVVEDEKSTPQARLSAVGKLHQMIQQVRDVIGDGGQFYDVLERLPQQAKEVVGPELVRFNELMTRVKDAPRIRAALDWVRGSDKIPQSADLSPVNVANVVTVAEVAPAKIDPDVADTILFHAERGDVQLSPAQRTAISTASQLARVSQLHSARAAKLKPSPSVVSEQIRTDRSGSAPKELSAVQHFDIVREAMRRGDAELAKSQLTRFQNWARTQQMKVEAINRHLVEGDGTQATGVQYENFVGGRWIKSREKMSVNPKKAATVDFAQRVSNDADALVTLSNNLAVTFPELGVEPLPLVSLAQDLQGGVEEVVRRYSQPRTEVREEEEEKTDLGSAPDQTVADDGSSDLVDNASEEPAAPTEETVEEVVEKPAKEGEPAAEVAPERRRIGRFDEALKRPTEQRSRLDGAQLARKVVVDRLEELELRPEIFSDYEKVLEGLDPLKKQLGEQLSSFLSKKLGDKTVREHLLEGTKPKNKAGEEYDLFSMQNGKALHLVEENDGELAYDEALIESASLAGLQWLLVADRYWSRVDVDAASDILGIPGYRVTDEQLARLNAGMGLVEVKRSLASMIERFWGLSADRSVDQALSTGIAESVAGEMIGAMIEIKALEDDTWDVRPSDGLPEGEAKRTVRRFAPKLVEDGDAVGARPAAIEEAVLVEAEPENFIGKPPSRQARTQMNNPLVENTPEQLQAIRNESATPYTLNQPLVEMWTKMGEDLFVRLFGTPDLDKAKLNKRHRATLEGRNQTIRSAYASVNRLLSQMDETASREAPVFFDHNMGNNGRMFMLGRNNPQASKVMREVLLPTGSTLDLSSESGADFSRYQLALAQALGVKVHNMSRRAAFEKLDAMLDGPLAPVLEELSGKAELSAEGVAAIREAFERSGSELDPMAFHALHDLARLRSTPSEERSKFRTQLYVEADGITNGPMNAIAMASSGRFGPDFVRNMGKGGVILTSADRTMNEHRSSFDPVDLYEETSRNLDLRALADTFDGRPELKSQMDSMLRLMLMFDKNVRIVTDPDTGERGVQFERGVAKNPLTITLYGSGVKGIAGNLVGALMENVYARMSEAAQAMAADQSLSFAQAMFGRDSTPDRSPEAVLQQFTRLMNAMTAQQVSRVRRTGTMEVGRVGAGRQSFDPLTYELSGEEFEAFAQNVQYLFVEPLRESIEKTVGSSVIESMNDIRQATQVQGIFLKYVFRLGVEKKLKELGRTGAEFLSKDEQQEVFDSLGPLAPFVETGAQTFLPSGSSKVDVGQSEFGRDFAERYRTDAYLSGPENPGVAGIPMMIIGMGDARMMQTMSTAEGAVQGTLKVFDGVNLPLDKIELGSEQANRAAFEAMMSNPLEAVLRSFEAFMDNVAVAELADEQRDELIRSLWSDKRGKDTSDAGIRAEMEALLGRLREKSASVEARHRVLRRVRMSVDQMAAVGAPYRNDPGEGAVDLEGLSADEAARVLNRELDAELLKMRDEAPEKTPQDGFSRALERVSVDGGQGVRTVSHNGLRRLLVNLEVPAAQKQILRQIVSSLATKQYRVVVGSAEQIAAWTEENGAQAAPAGPGSARVRGFTSFADKVVYVVRSGDGSVSSETLAHELVHAATFEQLAAYYQDGEVSQEAKDAVRRIELLANQFVKLSQEDQVPSESLEAFANARQAMREHLAKKTPLGKAAALNEFMAWSLTNEKLVEVLKNTRVDNPLVRLSRAAVRLIKQLVWGKQARLKVADDVLSNLQFNASVLINSAPSVRQAVGDTMLFQSEAYGSSERLREVEALLERKVVAYLDVEDLTDVDNLRRFNQAMMLGQEVADVFAARGFPMTMQEASLFRMLVSTLGTQAELDANALSEVEKLYAHVTKVLKVEDFLDDASTATDQDRYYAQERYDLVMGNLTSQKDAQGRSTLMSAFLALSMTSDSFRKVLSKLEVPKSKTNEWSSVDAVLDSVGTEAMQKLSEIVSGADRNATDVGSAMAALTERLLDQAQERESFIDQVIHSGHGVLDRANRFVIDLFAYGSSRVIDAANKLGERLGEGKGSRAAKGALEVAKLVASITNEERSDEITKGFMSQLNKAKALPRTLHELVNEIVGRTSETADVYDMIKLVRARVQQTRQQFREDLPAILNKKFSRKITEEEWSAMFAGMAKTDLAALQGMTADQITSAISDLADNPQALRSRVRDAEEEARSLSGSRWPQVQRKARELAAFMNGGPAPANLLRNAHAVSHLYGEQGFQPGFRAPRSMVKAVDQLTSLYALEGLTDAQKQALSSLAQQEPAGVSFVMSYLVGQRVDEVEKARSTPMAEANHYKGYVPSEAKSGYGVTVELDANAERLREMGYQRVADYEGSSAELGSGTAGQRGYYFSTVSGRAAFNQGIVQNVRPTAAGVDPLTGFTNALSTAGQVTDPQVVSQLSRRLRGRHSGREQLMPVYDGDTGQVVAYERSVDPLQEARVRRSTNLAEMIGAWRGRQVEEVMAEVFNERLAGRLKEMWERERGEKADEYVNLLDPKQRDPVVKDAASLMNKATRARMESLFGKDEMWVRRDLVNDVLGYREASLGDAWTGISRWPKPVQDAFKKLAHGVFGENAYRYLMKAERFVQNFVTDARVVIVVKSVVVPIANLAANFLQLLTRGVPVNDILRGMPRKTAEVKAYTDARLREIEAEAELRAVDFNGGDLVATRRLKAEIQAIRDGYRRLTIWPLVQAGEFSSISDVGVSRENVLLAEGRLGEYVERLTDRLPEGVRTLGRYALVTRDTSLFKGLQRAVEYGDFLGKAVLYEHLTKKQGMSQEDALAKITEEFVNYDRLPGRTRGALENNGLIWFWNFKIRAMKVAVSIIRNNPVHALLALNLPGLFGAEVPGSPVLDNGATVFADGSRFAYSVGIDQALHAHSLNPWLNLTGL